MEASSRVKWELVDSAIGSSAGWVFRVEVGKLDTYVSHIVSVNELYSVGRIVDLPGGLIELAVSREAVRASISCSSPGSRLNC